jgi:hypothetical protein
VVGAKEGETKKVVQTTTRKKESNKKKEKKNGSAMTIFWVRVTFTRYSGGPGIDA